MEPISFTKLSHSVIPSADPSVYTPRSDISSPTMNQYSKICKPGSLMETVSDLKNIWW